MASVIFRVNNILLRGVRQKIKTCTNNGTQPEAEQCSDRYVGLQKRQRYGLITHEISEVSNLRCQSNLKIAILDRMMFPYNGALYLGAFYHDLSLT